MTYGTYEYHAYMAATWNRIAGEARSRLPISEMDCEVDERDARKAEAAHFYHSEMAELAVCDLE